MYNDYNTHNVSKSSRLDYSRKCRIRRISLRYIASDRLQNRNMVMFSPEKKKKKNQSVSNPPNIIIVYVQSVDGGRTINMENIGPGRR